MKLKFLTIKKHTLCVILVSVILICSVVGVCYAVKATTSPKALYTIVIDAGHGGRDGGAVGSTGVTESELNLEFSLKLKEICEDYGFKVVLTRKDMNGLYSIFASNKKKSEMKKRQEIIEKAKPDVVVSIHMNSFSSSSSGAQCFYANGNESGQALATSVQQALSTEIEHTGSTAKVGDFYVLNCTNYASVLVECGFLSNAEEAVRLQSDHHQRKLAVTIAAGYLAAQNEQRGGKDS